MKLFVLVLVLSFPFAAAASAAPQQKSATSFETAPTGEFEEIDTEVGVWTASLGDAVIDAGHRKSGRRCLHIVGGERRQVVLVPRLDADVSALTFWAERWTRREPFEFRVERFDRGKWREVYRGDDEVVIGTFKTYVRVPLESNPAKLRFWCTSPSGVLIDDLRFARAAPMELASVTTRQPMVPCLIGKKRNTVARIEIETVGGLQPLSLREVRVNLRGTTSLDDVESVELCDPQGERFGRALPPARELVFSGSRVLQEGANALLVSVTLSPRADIDHFVDAGCDSIAFEDGTRAVPDVANPPGAQRCGIALRQGGDDGSVGYRIPGITTTNAGTLIAVYDIRWRNRGDLPGDIDVGMSRSVDGGRTWEPMKVILDMGNDPKFRYDGVGDPSILYDSVGDTIWVAATWSHGNRSWRGSGPGITPDETGQLMLVRSDDDGRTWSEPINITAQVKRPEWCFLLQGPGRGICMRDGTLVFAAQYQDTPEKKRMPHSTILYSWDRGKTWQLGTAPEPNTTEAQVAELDDGVLMLNMRDNRGGSRSVYTTSDMGETWTEHPTSRKALVEPVCNAALLRANEGTLLFVNPAVRKAPRRRMTIKASGDLGLSWPIERQLLIDEGTSAGYPSATMIDEHTVGVFFEGSAAHLTFMRVPLSALD